MKKRTKFKAWSFSRLQDYRRCPLQAKLKHLDKLPTTSGPALERGAEVHRYLQDVATGSATPKRREFAWVVKKVRDAVADREFDVERQWAFTADWSPSDWKDWERTVCRVKTDLVVYFDDAEPSAVLVVDHKTGRIKDREHREQGKLYALAAFQQLPEVQEVVVVIAYVDHEEQLDDVYTRDQVPELISYWRSASRRMLRARTFEPNPGLHCRWCDFSKRKGGPCVH